MPKTLDLLQTKSDFEQEEAWLAITVVLRVGNSGFGFWWESGWESACVVGCGLLKPTAAASAPQPIHLCSIHCDLASWAHVPVCVLLHVKMQAKRVPLLSFSPLLPLRQWMPPCFARQSGHGRREEQYCAVRCSLGFTSGAHSRLWQRFCFLMHANWSFTNRCVGNKLCQCFWFLLPDLCL